MAPRTTKRPLEPRKKPGQNRSTATVAAVLEAAARILETEGFEGYTTNAVARRAGISIGSLYQYFPSKDAITKALVLRESQVLLADVAALEREESGRAGLERLIQVAVASQFRRPALARLLDLEEQRLPLGDEVRRVGEHLAHTLQRFLDAPDLAGTFKAPFVVEDLLALIRGLVDGAGERGERDDAALIARVRRAVFGYLEHVPARRAPSSSGERR